MRRLVLLAIGARIIVGVPAQAQQERPLLGTPVFVLQPGAIGTVFADNAKAGRSSDLEFNARVATVIPIVIPRTAIVGIVQFTPANETEGYTSNMPEFVYGPVVNIINTRYFSFDGDALFAYSPSRSNPAASDYTHKFLVQGDLYIKIVPRMSLYASVAYVISGIDDPNAPIDPIETADRLVLLTGLSLPIAPWQ